MGTTGSIAQNFHEGTRSEYLAQYIFSAFGTSVPVPHPEDSGIDLYCTLGKKVGQRLHIQNYFLVQIKSNKEDIVYKGNKSVEWLLSHRYPFLICFVDKKSSLIEIYQTVILTTCFFKNDISSISLSTEAWEEPFPNIESKGDIKLNLGPPILKFEISEMEKQEWLNESKKILKSWIELDQDNINQKFIGLNFYRVPKIYKTNQVFDIPNHFVGNFKLNEKYQLQFYDYLFRLLTQLTHQIASEKDQKRFKVIADFAGFFAAYSSLKDSWGIRLLAIAVNTGSKYLNLHNRISLTHSDGTTVTPSLNIVKNE